MIGKADLDQSLRVRISQKVYNEPESQRAEEAVEWAEPVIKKIVTGLGQLLDFEKVE